MLLLLLSVNIFRWNKSIFLFCFLCYYFCYFYNFFQGTHFSSDCVLVCVCCVCVWKCVYKWMCGSERESVCVWSIFFSSLLLLLLPRNDAQHTRTYISFLWLGIVRTFNRVIHHFLSAGKMRRSTPTCRRRRSLTPPKPSPTFVPFFFVIK